MKVTGGEGGGRVPSACCGRCDRRPSFCGTGWLSGSTGKEEEEEGPKEAEQSVWAERVASCSRAASCCCCCCWLDREGGRGIRPHLLMRRTALRTNLGRRLRCGDVAPSCRSNCRIPLKEMEEVWMDGGEKEMITIRPEKDSLQGHG